MANPPKTSRTGLPPCPECDSVDLAYLPDAVGVFCQNCRCAAPPDYPLEQTRDETDYDYARRVWQDPVWRAAAAKIGMLKRLLLDVYEVGGRQAAWPDAVRDAVQAAFAPRPDPLTAV